MAKPANLWQQNYAQGVGAAGQKYEQGVRNPKRSWSGELVNAKPKMVQNFTAAMQGQRFDQAVNNIGDAGWSQKTIDKAANYASAATRAAAAYGARVQEMHAVVETAQARVNAMPRNTHQDNMNRMVVNATTIKEEWARRNGSA